VLDAPHPRLPAPPTAPYLAGLDEERAIASRWTGELWDLAQLANQLARYAPPPIRTEAKRLRPLVMECQARLDALALAQADHELLRLRQRLDSLVRQVADRVAAPMLGGKGPGKVAWHAVVLKIADANPTADFQKIWYLIREEVKADPETITLVTSERTRECAEVVGRQCVDGGHIHWRASARDPLRSASRTTLATFVSRHSPRRRPR